jgi:hypothetical protein
LVTQTDVRNTVAGRFHKRQFQTRKPQRANACGFLMVGRSAGVPPPTLSAVPERRFDPAL